MKITNITIKNCRGIKSLEIDNDIFSNKPNILVAPNGFGKTSIAHAFSSIIGHTKIDLSNEDRYNNNKENKAEINLSVENDERSITSLKVNENNYSNEIKKEFDVFVVSNAQKIKIRKQIFGKVFNATGHMTIEPIVICQKVKKVSIPISSAKLKKDLNVDDDIFFPIETLFTNKIFASLCIYSLDILKQLNTESIYNQMENILNKVRLSTSLQDQAQTIEGIHDMISTCSNFSEAFKLIKKAFKATDIKTFILISTLLKMYRDRKSVV